MNSSQMPLVTNVHAVIRATIALQENRLPNLLRSGSRQRVQPIAVLQQPLHAVPAIAMENYSTQEEEENVYKVSTYTEVLVYI